MSRLRGPVTFTFGSFVMLVAAASACAHTTGSHTGFQAKVSYIEPQQPGLLIQVLEGHVRLSAANLTRKEIVILDERGHAKVRIPAGRTRVWREPRIGAAEPPPDQEGLVRNWRIRGNAEGEPFEIVGFLGYRPPPDASSDDGWPRWAIVIAALAGAVVLAVVLAVPMIRREEET